MAQIRINLLPEELRGRTQRKAGPKIHGPRPRIWVVLTLMAIVGADGYWLYYVVNSRIQAEKAFVAASKIRDEKKAILEKNLKSFEEYNSVKQQLETKMKILASLDPPDRLLWSAKLNMLAQMVHDHIFIINLKMTEKPGNVETPASIANRSAWAKAGKEGAPPKPITVPMITQTLSIDAICTGASEAEQLENARKFMSDLQQFSVLNARGEPERFMEGFARAEYTKIETIPYQGKQVNRFTYILTTKPVAVGI